ncbi:MAG TPA: hypothetical protein VK891_00420 [Euzebyales bacterium]|nr:hypothetical protein [Euzebyales bacterium]
MTLIVVGLGLLAAGHAAAASRPDLTLVSTSGIPHHDVADYTTLPSWRPGLPTGLNASWRAALDVAIGQIASEDPDAVFHTGDMGGGRWGRDPDATGLFGPVGTWAQRRRAIERAAALYYKQNKQWWRRHGLNPYFGVGDHEVGDVGSSGVIARGGSHYAMFPTWRRAWAKAFTDDGAKFASHPPGQHRRTAYATMIDDVGFVTLDPFMRREGAVYTRIGWRQLHWLDDVLGDLRNRGARFLIVQCETPALGPNRRSRTSGLLLDNGDMVWQVLRDNGVDLFLTSEFHEMTTHSDAGTTPVQVVHGGQLYRGTMSYLVIETFPDRMELQLKRVYGRQTGTGRIWAPRYQRAPDGVRMYRGARTVGTMTIHRDGSLSDRSGYLRDGLSPVAADTGPRPADPKAIGSAQRPAEIGTPQPSPAPATAQPSAAPERATSPATSERDAVPPPFVAPKGATPPARPTALWGPPPFAERPETPAGRIPTSPHERPVGHQSDGQGRPPTRSG